VSKIKLTLFCRHHKTTPVHYLLIVTSSRVLVFHYIHFSGAEVNVNVVDPKLPRETFVFDFAKFVVRFIMYGSNFTDYHSKLE